MKAKRIPNKHVNGKGCNTGYSNYKSALFIVEHWRFSDIPAADYSLFTTTENSKKLVTKIIYADTDWVDRGFNDDEDNVIYFNSHLEFNNDAEIIKLLKPSEILKVIKYQKKLSKRIGKNLMRRKVKDAWGIRLTNKS